MIQGRTVAVLGYGSQGHAHALSLRDCGVDVRVGLPEGSKSRAKVVAAGMSVMTPLEAAAEADLIMMLAPDHIQRKLYAELVEPHLQDGDALFFGHGFNLRFGYITPRQGVDVCIVAPKGPGQLVRREFTEGRGVPVLVAVENDATGNARDLTLSYAKAVVGLRAGGIRTTFTEECGPDLFGKQAVLCGGASQLVQYGFETLIEAGGQPEVAYFDCLHEFKLFVDLMYEGGIAKQRGSASDTAEYGDYVSGPRVIDPSAKVNMQAVLADIQNGASAQRFIDDQDAGAPEFTELRARGEQHPIEATGRKLRRLMSWAKITDSDYVEGTKARVDQAPTYRRQPWRAFRPVFSARRDPRRPAEGVSRPRRSRIPTWCRGNAPRSYGFDAVCKMSPPWTSTREAKACGILRPGWIETVTVGST